jgi:hypothetical protein
MALHGVKALGIQKTIQGSVLTFYGKTNIFYESLVPGLFQGFNNTALLQQPLYLIFTVIGTVELDKVLPCPCSKMPDIGTG